MSIRQLGVSFSQIHQVPCSSNEIFIYMATLLFLSIPILICYFFSLWLIKKICGNFIGFAKHFEIHSNFDISLSLLIYLSQYFPFRCLFIYILDMMNCLQFWCYLHFRIILNISVIYCDKLRMQYDIHSLIFIFSMHWDIFFIQYSFLLKKNFYYSSYFECFCYSSMELLKLISAPFPLIFRFVMNFEKFFSSNCLY